LCAAGAAGCGKSDRCRCQQAPHPTAKALGYNEDATKVDAKKSVNYKPGQLCSNCLQQTGKAGDTWRPCNLFVGKLVNANGWCNVYIKNPAVK
jgi:hypothetical protein